MTEYSWTRIPRWDSFEVDGRIVTVSHHRSYPVALVETNDETQASDDTETALMATFQEMDYGELQERVRGTDISGNLPQGEMAEEYANYVVNNE